MSKRGGLGPMATCHPDKRHEAHGLCVNCYQKSRKNYREGYRKKNLNKSLRRTGITEDRYRELLTLQGGVCAICKGDPNGKGRLAIDHDHKTGEARGLLCSNCNPGLGFFKDDPLLLAQAIRYLATTSAKH